MTTTETTLNELIDMRRDVAVLVQRFGDQFMPIFQRLDNEVSAREGTQGAIERAINAQSQ